MKQLLSTLLVSAALVGAPLAAAADPKPVAAQTQQGPKAATAEDTSNYAEREAQDKAPAEFDGGASGIYIGGGALTVVLIVLLIVLLV